MKRLRDRQREEIAGVVLRAAEGARLARLRRNDTMEDWATRLDTSVASIRRLERGNTGVSLDVWLRVMREIGTLPSFAEGFAPHNDAEGQRLASRGKPKQQRARRRPEEADPFELFPSVSAAPRGRR